MERDKELEDLVLNECLVSAVGLTDKNLQIGIRGDPSLRETTFARKRYKSDVDNVFNDLMPHLTDLLLRRSTYRLYIGFNNGEIRTNSVFDPFRLEIHSADKLTDPHYIERHFPEIDYDDKVQVITDIYQSMDQSGIYDRLPDYWRRIITKRNNSWTAMAKEDASLILSKLDSLREIQEYYLRNISVCIMQSVVRIQFNCDGTQLVRSKDFKQFIDDNIPTE
ncbi:MAG: hypothetical protein HN790_08690 [Methylococcales bacterium]|nr:hypothetical protein [Methylococcales bacterium]